MDVIFLDTGYHFPETIGTRDAVDAWYPINVTPTRTVAEQDAELGPRLYGRKPDLCCYLRKVVPLERALDPCDAWITGVRQIRGVGAGLEWTRPNAGCTTDHFRNVCLTRTQAGATLVTKSARQ